MVCPTSLTILGSFDQEAFPSNVRDKMGLTPVLQKLLAHIWTWASLIVSEG